jgi:succinate dehydrogenase/fumarate reductase flavoprotein subunit
VDRQQLAKSLRRAIRSLEKALQELEDDTVREQGPTYVSTCTVCKKPILASDVVKRGVHEPCYQSVYQQFIRTGEKTADELEAAGVLGPKAKAGRKPTRDFDELTARAQRRIDGGDKEK